MNKYTVWKNYKIKRESVDINGYKVPRPVDIYNDPIISSVNTLYKVALDRVVTIEYKKYKDTLGITGNLGIYHLTKEAAEIHRLALLSFTTNHE